MNIDWAAFTPYSALAGGALIGLASAILILGIGRVAGYIISAAMKVIGANITDDITSHC